MSGEDLERLSRAKYVLVTTYRKDGRAVPTPVWAARDGDELVVWTVVDSGKVKRIRRDGTVQLAKCDVRGNPSGDPVPGRARLLDAERSSRVRLLIAHKYGLLGRISMVGSRIRRGANGTVGIAITVGDGSLGDEPLGDES